MTAMRSEDTAVREDAAPPGADTPGRPGVAAEVTIAICTRNRPRDLRRALASVLRVAPRGVSVLVVDQGDQAPVLGDDRPRPLGSAACVTWHRDPGRGASRARNVALQAAGTPLVVFVDDDCTLRPGAVERLVEVLQDTPDAAVAFGTVTARDVDEGFIPTYHPQQPRVLRGRGGKFWDGGIGALMAVRRDEVLAAGGFDERLGAGVHLAACEDGELAYRLLRRGYAVLHVPDAVVDHHGVRAWAEGRQYAFRTYRGIGAAYALHLRRGDPWAAGLLAQQFALVLGGMAASLVRRGRPAGVAKVAGLLAGIGAGFGMRPWDRAYLESRIGPAESGG